MTPTTDRPNPPTNQPMNPKTHHIPVNHHPEAQRPPTTAATALAVVVPLPARAVPPAAPPPAPGFGGAQPVKEPGLRGLGLYLRVWVFGLDGWCMTTRVCGRGLENRTGPCVNTMQVDQQAYVM